MWEKILSYLTFTRKERLGVLVLLVIILLLFVLPNFIRPANGSPDPQADQKYQEGIRKFQSADFRGSDDRQDLPVAYHDQRSDDAGHSNNSRDQMRFTQGENLQWGKAKNKSALFYFDPNRITGEDWRRLGLPDQLILTISHYIQKGGSFRTAADLKKLYGLKTEDFERLFPYVRIGKSGAADFSRKYLAAAPPAYPHTAYRKNHSFKSPFNRNFDSAQHSGYTESPSEYSDHPYAKKKMEDLDINLADSSTWSRLPGIGIKLACRIVHFRDKLGGFYSADQLRETFGLPDSTFRQIRPFLHASTPDPQRINLNTAAQETLQEHPYIRWKLAKGIIQYREQHGGFKSVGELQQLVQMDSEKFKKLEPYLEVK